MISALARLIGLDIKAQALPVGHSGFVGDLDKPRGLAGFGLRSSAGPHVSPQTVLGLSAVWACTVRTAELVASLPAAVYRKTDRHGRVESSDELDEILTVSPNPEQTAFEFWEGIVAQMLIRGNGPSEKLMIGNRVVGLRPLLNAEPVMQNGQLVRWQVQDRGKMETLPASKVFNIPGFGIGGGVGISAVRHGVNSFGAALAADETSAHFFANAMQPGGVVEWNPSVNFSPTGEQIGKLRALIENFTGSRKTGKTLPLPPGASYRQITLNPEDAQLLETRRYAVEDICRWFGVPPIIIGHASDGQTMWGSGVEAIMLSWLTLGVNPLLRRIEARVKKDLVPVERRRTDYFEFTREAMLQMDSKSKAEFMSKMGASGTMTANERRARMNLSRSDDPNADRLLAQTALAPLETLGGNTK